MSTPIVSPEEIRAAGDALKIFAKSFITGGGSPIALSAAMSAVGTGALSGLTGPGTAAEVHRIMAEKIDAARGEEDDVAAFVQRALEGSTGHDHGEVMRAALAHAALSIAAIDGADQAVREIRSVAAQIEEAAGNARRDLN